MYEGLLVEVENVIENYQKLYNAIPHICSCCIGCECEKVDNSGCESGFIPSADRIEKLIKNAHKESDGNLIPLSVCERKIGNCYWYINSVGEVEFSVDRTEDIAKDRYNVGNYCRDKKEMEQRALHEIMDRLLWQFSEIYAKDNNEWDGITNHYFIMYNKKYKRFEVETNLLIKNKVIYFNSYKGAIKAIEEVIKPFITKHPEFEW